MERDLEAVNSKLIEKTALSESQKKDLIVKETLLSNLD